MSGLNGQRLANLTLQRLQGMQTSQDFDLFFESVKKKATKLDVEEPSLPRKRRRPKFSILQFFEGYEETSRNTKAFHPETTSDHYRSIFYDANDTVIMAIKDRFEQPSYKFFSTIERLLIKTINSEPCETELEALNKYKDDFNVLALPAELLTLRTIFANEKVSCFEEIKNKIKTETSEAKRILIGKVIKLMKLVLVGAATSATPEPSFSLARRSKTWLRSTMSQKRFNALAILSFYKELVDKISLYTLFCISNTFISNARLQLAKN